MEILKKFCPVTVACFLLFASVIACFAGGVPFPAYADSQSDIGGGSLRIQIAPMSSDEESLQAPSFYTGGVWGQDKSTGEYSVLNGAVLSVKVPADADVYVAYDLDLAGDLWSIKGDYVKDGVPYLKLDDSTTELFTNRGYDDPVADGTVGEYYPASWRFNEHSADGSEAQFIFRIANAGNLSVRVEKNGEINEEDYVVNNIDWTGAKPVYNELIGGYMMGLQTGSADGLPTYSVRIDFTDAFPDSVPASATSGIRQIYILRFDQSLAESEGDETPDFSEEELEELNDRYIPYETTFTSMTRNATVRFDLKQDGWYYYYTMDTVGNISIGPLLDNKLVISGDPDYVILQEVAGGTEVLYNTQEVIEQAEEFLRIYSPGGENPVNADLYDDLDSALAELTFAYRTLGTDDAARKKKAELYFDFFNGVYTDFKNAVESGKTVVDGEVINAYLADGSFVWNGLESAVKGDPGDEVFIRIALGVVDKDMHEYGDVLSAAGIGGRIIRIEYTLYINGEPADNERIVSGFSLNYFRDASADCAFVSFDGENYRNVTVAGANFDRIILQNAYGVIYLVEEGGQGVPYWVWIIVAAGVAAIVAAAVILILYKKGVIGKHGKRNTVNADKGTRNAENANSDDSSDSPGKDREKAGQDGGKSVGGKGDYDD